MPIAHAAMGAVVAAIGNGDALGGALGAGAAEAVRPATAKSDTATQETVSALVGALAGGGTGLDGEKFNRQLHQDEIKWIKNHAKDFAMSLNGGVEPSDEELRDAKARLSQQSLRQVDKGWSLKLGSENDVDAKSFLNKNDAKLFKVKNEYEFKDGSTDGEHEISALSKDDFNNLSSFYNENVHRPTTTNPDGTLRNANENYANEKGLIDALNNSEIGVDEFNQALRTLVPNAIQSIGDIPDTANSAANYLDAVLPTKNQERLDALYGSHTDGSVLQANISTSDAITTGAMLTGVGAVGKTVGKGIVKSIDNKVYDALDINFASPRIDENPFGLTHNLSDLEKINVNGTQSKRIVEGEHGGIVVIGRSMWGDGGVIDYTNELNRKGYATLLYADDEISKASRSEWTYLINNKADKDGRLRNNQIFGTVGYYDNKAWAKKVKNEGFTIIDIGDPHNKGFSPYYSIEKKTIFGNPYKSIFNNKIKD